MILKLMGNIDFKLCTSVDLFIKKLSSNKMLIMNPVEYLTNKHFYVIFYKFVSIKILFFYGTSNPKVLCARTKKYCSSKWNNEWVDHN